MSKGFFGSKTLLALILFVLQFGRCDMGDRCGFIPQPNPCDDECGPIPYENCGCRRPIIDNSILFIIALYFICCCTNNEGC